MKLKGISSYLMPVALVGLVMAQHTLSKNFSSTWQGGWAIIAMVATFIVARLMWQAKLAYFIPLFVVVVLSGLGIGLAGSGFPTSGITDWPIGKMTNISVHVSSRMFSLISLVSFVSMVVIGISISKKTANIISWCLCAAGIFTGISIIVEGLFLGHPVSHQVWIIDNPGCAATFSVFGHLWLLAKIRESRNIARGKNIALALVIILSLSAVLFLVKASTPIAAAAIGVLMLLKAENPRAALTVLLLTGAAAVAFIYFHGYSIESDASGRTDVWRKAYEFWSADNVRMALGKGLGTTTMVLPLLTSQGWYFLHSDLLQIPFELGLLGLGAALLAGGRVMYGLREDRAMIVVAAAFAVTMVTNFSSHISIDALWALVLVRRAV